MLVTSCGQQCDLNSNALKTGAREAKWSTEQRGIFLACEMFPLKNLQQTTHVYIKES